jgi:GNAT superfamily N-acetyltransferase
MGRETTGVDGYEISADKARLDVPAIHRWLSEESYWAAGRPLATQEKAIESSLCVGAYAPDGTQAGFARVVTDGATFAWLCDVFVFPGHRGHGLARALVQAAMDEVPAVRRWVLATQDAHGVYEPFGFAPLDPGRWMEMRR